MSGEVAFIINIWETSRWLSIFPKKQICSDRSSTAFTQQPGVATIPDRYSAGCVQLCAVQRRSSLLLQGAGATRIYLGAGDMSGSCRSSRLPNMSFNTSKKDLKGGIARKRLGLRIGAEVRSKARKTRFARHDAEGQI
jgi:hypothetical protein